MHLREAAREVDGELLADIFGASGKVWKMNDEMNHPSFFLSPFLLLKKKKKKWESFLSPSLLSLVWGYLVF